MGGFSYPDQFNFEVDLMPEATGASVLGVFLVVYLLLLLVILAFSLVCYVLNSLGLYTIANRRGIRHSWLAWLPIGNVWILGNISDQYQYVAKGKVKNRRKVLLGLHIGLTAALIGWFVAIVISIALSEAFVGGLVAFLLVAILGYLLLIALAITLVVFQYMCLYDLYTSCNPNDGVLLLVLSILFSVTMPFFVFAYRKKDLGMPPKKQPAPQQVVVPTVEVVVDPTVVEQVVVPTVEPVTEEGFAQPEEFEEE